jgi:hypothetical protein
MQNFWHLGVYVFFAYMATSALFTALLYPAYLLDHESFSGGLPANFSPLAAIFCMALGALAQTAISISELAPASYYTIAVVTAAHFFGVCLHPQKLVCRPKIVLLNVAIFKVLDLEFTLPRLRYAPGYCLPRSY